MTANLRPRRRGAVLARGRQSALLGGLVNIDPSEFSRIRINASWTFLNGGSSAEQIAMGILISRDGIPMIEGHWLPGHFDVTTPADNEQGNLDTFRNQTVTRRRIDWNPTVVFVGAGTISATQDFMDIGIDLLAGHANYDIRLQLVRLRGGGVVEPANARDFADHLDVIDFPDPPPLDDFALNNIGAGATITISGI